jgi:hypothetical protein
LFDDLDVVQPLRRPGHLRGVADVERDRDQPVVGHGGGVADPGIHLGRPAREEFLRDGLADPAVRAGDQSYGSFDLHGCPFTSEIWMMSII